MPLTHPPSLGIHYTAQWMRFLIIFFFFFFFFFLRMAAWLLDRHHFVGCDYAADAVPLLPVHSCSFRRLQKDDRLSQPHLVSIQRPTELELRILRSQASHPNRQANTMFRFMIKSWEKNMLELKMEILTSLPSVKATALPIPKPSVTRHSDNSCQSKGLRGTSVHETIKTCYLDVIPHETTCQLKVSRKCVCEFDPFPIQIRLIAADTDTSDESCGYQCGGSHCI